MLDFDYLIISNQIFDEKSVSATLRFFSERGIRRFYVAFNVDLSQTTIKRVAPSIKALQKRFSSLCPRGSSVHVYPMLSLSEDAVKNPCVPKLSFGQKMIFTNLPFACLSDHDSWMDENLNFLVRKLRLTPIFLSFEEFLALNDSATANHFLYGSGFSFGFDLNFLTLPSHRFVIEEMIQNKIPAYPIMSDELFYYVGIEKSMQAFKDLIGKDLYVQFCRSFFQNGNLLK